MNVDQKKELHQLIDGVLNSPELTEIQKARLNELLMDEEARTEYLQHVAVDTYIERAVEMCEIQDLVDEEPKSIIRFSYISAMAAACIVLIGATFIVTQWWSGRLQGGSVTDPIVAGELEVEVKAEIRSMFGVVWKSGSANLRNCKKIEIEQGLVEIVHASGVTVLLEGPACYEVDGMNSAKLEYGKCVAHVPKGAEGYTIDYKQGRVVDLGTEFAIEVEQSGEATIGVFKGEVKVVADGVEQDLIIRENSAVLVNQASEDRIVSIPFKRVDYVRNMPSREFAWDMIGRESSELKFDVSHLIWQSGKYCAVLKWMKDYAADITAVKLYRNGRLESEDRHSGQVGSVTGTIKNRYFLNIGEVNGLADKWELVVEMKVTTPTRAEVDEPLSQGVLLFEDQRFKAQFEDFIGTWVYEHDGKIFKRVINSDGTVHLYIDGKRREVSFKGCKWLVKEGVFIVETPFQATERCLLRDKNTMLFINQPYRNAKRVDEK